MNTLKCLLFCSGFMFFAGSLDAQQGFGLKAGLNFADIKAKGESTPLNDSYELAIYYHAGVYWGVPLVGNLSLSPEVLLSLKGVKFDEDNLFFRISKGPKLLI